MANKAVIGLAYGDEGKGLFTDYLCSQSTNPLVIRYSGGQQAGHTVASNGMRHVFSNFGAGTLKGAPSYFSKFCTIDPVGIVNELSVLLDKGIKPLLFIDAQCPVTTPYDIAYNQKNNKHGSCGVGVGDTINREEHYYSLTFADLFYPWVLETKLTLIKAFYSKYNQVDLSNFLACCEIICHSVYIEKTYGLPKNNYSYIFEGSQGLLLDKNIGFFPHVTRTNTGTQNVLSLLGHETLSTYLVTRAYQTRHGDGPLSNESIPHNISKNPNETNITNPYQGALRIALLDVSLLEYAINKDEYLRSTKNKSLVITCLDHIHNEYRFTYLNAIIYCKNETEFVSRIANILNISNVYISHSEDSKDIRCFQKENNLS
jgi:adenylosuccinate synthase